MGSFKQFHLKNEMLVANFLANFIGVTFVNGILAAAISALDDFCRPRERDDDVTLVVVKVET